MSYNEMADLDPQDLGVDPVDDFVAKDPDNLEPDGFPIVACLHEHATSPRQVSTWLAASTATPGATKPPTES